MNDQEKLKRVKELYAKALTPDGKALIENYTAIAEFAKKLRDRYGKAAAHDYRFYVIMCSGTIQDDDTFSHLDFEGEDSILAFLEQLTAHK